MNNIQPIFSLAVIASVDDPSESNRVQCRVIGKHAGAIDTLNSVSTINDADLPWYNVLMPNTSASVSGTGSTIGLAPGSWVFGTYLDGENQQEAIIIGSLAGTSTVSSSEHTYEYPLSTGSDTPAAATGAAKTIRQPFAIDIPLATAPQLSSLSDDDKEESQSISTPDPEEWYGPVYPNNRVTQTASGHRIEYDDTPGKERIAQTHASGTTSQIINDGSKIESIVGDGFTVYNKNNTVYIVGNCNLAVDGDASMRVGGDYKLDIDGDMYTNVLGNRVTKVGLNDITEVLGKRELNIGKTDLLKVGQSQTVNVVDDQLVTIDGNQTIKVGVNRLDNVIGNSNIIVGKARQTTVTLNDESIALGSQLFTSTTNMKINCPEKITINTPIQQVSGDVIAGSGGVSLITHVHRQKDGNDKGGGSDTAASTSGTGVGS